MNESFEPTLFGAARAHRALVAMCALAGVLMAIVLGLTILSKQVATSSILVEDPQGSTVFEQSSTRDPQRYVADQVAIIESAEVARAAAEEVGGPVVSLSVKDLLGLRRISSNPESGLIEVSVIDRDEDTVIAFSNALLVAYQEVKDERTETAFVRAIDELDSSIAIVEAELSDLDAQILENSTGVEVDEQLREAILELIDVVNDAPNLAPEDLDRALQQLQVLQLIRSVQGQDPFLATLIERRTQALNQRAQLVLRRDQVGVDAALATSGVILFSPAETAERSMGFGRLTAIGLLLGLGTGVALAFNRSKRAKRFENRFEPGSILDAPLLAEVPNFIDEELDSSLPVRDAPLSAAAESFRFAGAALSDRIELGGVGSDRGESGSDCRIIAITSPLIGDGKTVTAANVGAALATKGKRVLLIDADFGDQSLTGLISDYKGWHPGLTDMAEVGVALTTAIRSVHVRDGLTVDLLSRGSQSIAAPEFFRREAVSTLFSEIRASYDLILVDVPPMLQVAYSGSVVRLCDSVVLVVAHGGDATSLVEATNRVGLTGKEVTGYIYNKAPLREEMLIRRGSMRDPLGLGLRPDIS